MNWKALITNIIILTLLIVVIGVALFAFFHPNIKPGEIVSFVQKIPLRIKQAHLTDATARKILNVPSQNASEEEKMRYEKFLDEEAVATSEIVIEDCIPDPLAIKTKVGRVLKIFNRDKTSHKLTIDKYLSYTLEPGQNNLIQAKFGRLGPVGYKCDDSPVVGVFQISAD